MTTVLVVDDHPLVARGIADFLQSHCNFDQAVPFTVPNDLWSHVLSTGEPTLFVVDFWLSGKASLSLLREIRRKYPATPLLVMSADDDDGVRSRVAEAGASGFINKQASPDDFVLAVKSLLSGETWFERQPSIQTKRLEGHALTVTARELGLTARQGDVLALILQGLPNKRIAQTLALSEQTVKEHVTGILERLGARNRIELITRLNGRRLE